jgi:multicomponent Na+:H+ antiporter subunit D
MVELGLYTIARIYWMVFSEAQPGIPGIRNVFITMGALTALLGALYCYGQRHLKRLLAFSTVSHVGVMLMGFALLDPRALAGAALYLLGHGLIKGSMFIGAGILLHRFGSVDEYDIDRLKRQIAPIGLMMVVGAWGLAGLPPFSTYFGEEQMDHIASAEHLSWLSDIAMFAEVMTAAAILRFTGRVFFGMGHGHSIASQGAPHIHMEVETRGTHSRVPIFMWLPMAGLLIIAMVIPISLRRPAEHYAQQFQNTPTYYAAVLQQDAREFPAPRAYAASDVKAEAGLWKRMVVALGTVGVAAVGLFPLPRKSGLSTVLEKTIAVPLLRLRPLQSGRVGDYVAWLAFGIAAYGGMLLLLH